MPSILILVFKIVLVYTIVKSKSQLSTFYTTRENEIYKKDVYLSLLALVMSILNIIASLPAVIVAYGTKDFFAVFVYFHDN